MQPPDTEPTTTPSSRMAMMDPTGRGDDPHVRITVTRIAPRCWTLHAWSCLRTCRSRFSIQDLIEVGGERNVFPRIEFCRQCAQLLANHPDCVRAKH